MQTGNIQIPSQTLYRLSYHALKSVYFKLTILLPQQTRLETFIISMLFRFRIKSNALRQLNDDHLGLFLVGAFC